MGKDELENAMRAVLAKVGKPPEEVDKVVPFLLSQPSLQTDENRLVFFKQWSNKL